MELYEYYRENVQRLKESLLDELKSLLDKLEAPIEFHSTIQYAYGDEDNYSSIYGINIITQNGRKLYNAFVCSDSFSVHNQMGLEYLPIEQLMTIMQMVIDEQFAYFDDDE